MKEPSAVFIKEPSAELLKEPSAELIKEPSADYNERKLIKRLLIAPAIRLPAWFDST
jgi:hypothetical protein